MDRRIVGVALALAACSSEKQPSDADIDAPDPATDLNGGAVSGSRFKLV